MGIRHSSQRKKTKIVIQTNLPVDMDTGSCRGSEHAWASVASSSPLPYKQVHDSDLSSLDVVLPQLQPESPVGLAHARENHHGSQPKQNMPEDDSGGKLSRTKSAVNPLVRAFSAVSGVKALVRSRSLPANSARRADINIDPETMRKVVDLQERLSRELSRRTEEKKKSVSDLSLKDFMDANCQTWIYGMQTLTGTPGSERTLVGGQLPKHVAIKCVKGAKGGSSDTSPNQDNFSYTLTKSGGFELFTVQDGHGTSGHVVSFRTVRTLPYFVMRSKHFPKDVPAAIREGYQKSQEDLLKDSVEKGYDIQISGCACVLMVRCSEKLWISHTGDSRIVVGALGSTETVYETKDHKPTSPRERKRLEENGSVVLAFEYEDGQVSISRVFVKGADYPGLCMSRSLGDQSVKEHGVTAEPDIHELSIQHGKNFVVLASDGVWEFISSKLVVSSLSKKLTSEGLTKCADRILTESKKRWRQFEGTYCDDITAMVINLT